MSTSELADLHLQDPPRDRYPSGYGASSTVAANLPPVTHSDRMHTVHKWLQLHIQRMLAEQQQTVAEARRDVQSVRQNNGDMHAADVREQRGAHLQPLLTDALNTYATCKRTSSSTSADTWCAPACLPVLYG